MALIPVDQYEKEQVRSGQLAERDQLLTELATLVQVFVELNEVAGTELLVDDARRSIGRLMNRLAPEDDDAIQTAS